MVPLIAETWIWWSVVALIFIMRFISRILHQGSIKNLQLDDWVMWLAMITYTSVIVTINITATLNTNLLPEGFDVAAMSASEKMARIYGSKMVLVVEQCQCLTVWLTKACILIMYMRLTKARPEHRWVQALVVYTAGTFAIMEVLYLGVWCRPFYNYWAVPTPNVQCSTALHHLIVNCVFNISQDLILLAIALPMFLRTQMPMRKKLALCGVFSLGIFVIIASALNKYYSFTNPYGSAWTFWYTRESSTAMLVANLPFVYTLLRKMFHLRSLDSTAQYGYGSKSGRTKKTGAKSGARTAMGTLLSRVRDDDRDEPVNVFAGLDGITKEVGVTFVSQPAWLEEGRGLGKSGLDKGNMVTITAGPVGSVDEEHEMETLKDRGDSNSNSGDEDALVTKPAEARRSSGAKF